MMEDIEAKDCYFKHLQSCKRLKEGKRNKTGPISSSLTEGPQPVSKEKMIIRSEDRYLMSSLVSVDDEIHPLMLGRYSKSMKTEKKTIGSKGKYVSKSSDDERKFYYPERYRTRNLSFERTKSSPTMGIEKMTIRSDGKYVRSLSDDEIHPLVNETQKTPIHLSFERTKSSTNMGTDHTTLIKDNEEQYCDCFENSPTVDQSHAKRKTRQDAGNGTAEDTRYHTTIKKDNEDEYYDCFEYLPIVDQSKAEQKAKQDTRTGMGENPRVESKGSWRWCFENSSNFKSDAKRLLLEGSLPDQRLLQDICKANDRKSEMIRAISKGICQNIKEQSNNIVHVWPAYQHEHDIDFTEFPLVFVVITNKQTNIQSDYRICQRPVNKISWRCENENKLIHDQEKLYDLKSEDLELSLKSKVKQLMETHKNLTWVTVSAIKSSKYNKSDHRIVKLPCIALYVQIKGLIPIDEDPFEQFIDGYPIDVREGVFSLFGLSTELHQNVRMGCALDSGYGTKQGTVGPFFKYETDLHTYLLTSAHVLLDPEQMKKLILDTKVYYGMIGTDTYQPPESISFENNSRHHLGKLEFAVYREGGQYKPGMEVALVRIDNQRVPIDGKFPTNENNDDNILSLNHNCGYSKQFDPDVYKYGSVTGLTKGKVRFNGSSVRTGILNDHFLGMDLTLHEQIEVESADGVPFGEQGDSGALVFKKDEDKLFVIGILEGKIGNTYMVTPICGIIEVLSEFMSLYRDPPTDTRMDFDELISNITLMLYHVPCNNAPLSGGIDHHISAEISRKTNEIQTHILHHTEHRFDSVKAELTAIKMYIENKIDNSHREIIESINALSQAVSKSNNVTSPNT